MITQFDQKNVKEISNNLLNYAKTKLEELGLEIRYDHGRFTSNEFEMKIIIQTKTEQKEMPSDDFRKNEDILSHGYALRGTLAYLRNEKKKVMILGRKRSKYIIKMLDDEKEYVINFAGLTSQLR